MLPVLVGLGATVISTISATAEAALIGASVGAAAALGTSSLKRSYPPPAPPSFRHERMADFDEEVFEAAFKQALRIACQHRRTQIEQ